MKINEYDFLLIILSVFSLTCTIFVLLKFLLSKKSERTITFTIITSMCLTDFLQGLNMIFTFFYTHSYINLADEFIC